MHTIETGIPHTHSGRSPICVSGSYFLFQEPFQLFGFAKAIVLGYRLPGHAEPTCSLREAVDGDAFFELFQRWPFDLEWTGADVEPIALLPCTMLTAYRSGVNGTTTIDTLLGFSRAYGTGTN